MCVWLVKWESGRSRQLAGAAAAAAYASGSKMAAGGFRDLLIAPTGFHLYGSSSAGSGYAPPPPPAQPSRVVFFLM